MSPQEKAVESLRDKLVDTKSRAKTRLETIKSLKEKISHYQVQVDNKPEVEDERPLIAESVRKKFSVSALV